MRTQVQPGLSRAGPTKAGQGPRRLVMPQAAYEGLPTSHVAGSSLRRGASRWRWVRTHLEMASRAGQGQGLHAGIDSEQGVHRRKAEAAMLPWFVRPSSEPLYPHWHQSGKGWIRPRQGLGRLEHGGQPSDAAHRLTEPGCGISIPLSTSDEVRPFAKAMVRTPARSPQTRLAQRGLRTPPKEQRVPWPPRGQSLRWRIQRVVSKAMGCETPSE